MRVAVFTGSSFGESDKYAQAAAGLARHLVANAVGIVYGGAHVGLMGIVADTALEAGGEVVGVIPGTLVDAEIAHRSLSELHVVTTMHERKALMAERADAFVALPGGAGTLEEVFEVWTWQHLGLHRKPIVMVNTAGYWTPLVRALDQMVDAGFLHRGQRDSLRLVDEPEQVLTAIRDWRPPTGTRWDDDSGNRTRARA